jgi:PQQ-like domain
MIRWPRLALVGVALVAVTAPAALAGPAGARTRPAPSKLTKVWSAKLIGPGTAPVVAGTDVYVTAIAAKLPKKAGGIGSELYAVNATCPAAPAGCAATVAWTHPYPVVLAAKQPFAVDLTPTAVGNGNVYMGLNQIGADQYDGNEAAFGAASGAAVFSNGQGGTSTPAVAGGVVATNWQFQCCFAEEAFTGTEALNASTGAPLFTTPPGTGTTPPAVGDGSLFEETGGSLSAYDASGSTCPPPAGDPTEIEEYAQALRFPEVCAPIWNTTTDGALGPPAVFGTTMYVGSSNGEVYVFPAGGCGSSTCSPRWTGTTSGAITTSVAVSSTTVYVTSSNGVLSAFPAAGCGSSSCTPTWTATVGGTPSAPTVAGASVYVTSSSGELLAFPASGCGAATCVSSWHGLLRAPSDTAPAVGNGLIFVTDTHRLLYAFRQPSS